MKKFYGKLKGILYKEDSLKQELEESLDVILTDEAELGELIKETDERIDLKKIKDE